MPNAPVASEPRLALLPARLLPKVLLHAGRSRPMSRTVYVNGSFVPEADAKVSVFDRAFLFAEGVYEVTAVLGGKPLDLENHLARLDRSLAEMQIDPPLSHAELRALHAELIALNKVDEGVVY